MAAAAGGRQSTTKKRKDQSSALKFGGKRQEAVKLRSGSRRRALKCYMYRCVLLYWRTAASYFLRLDLKMAGRTPVMLDNNN